MMATTNWTPIELLLSKTCAYCDGEIKEKETCMWKQVQVEGLLYADMYLHDKCHEEMTQPKPKNTQITISQRTTDGTITKVVFVTNTNPIKEEIKELEEVVSRVFPEFTIAITKK